VFEKRTHLGLRFEIKLIVPKSESAFFIVFGFVSELAQSRLGLFFTRVDAEQDVVCVVIFLVHVVRVVGANNLDVVLLRPAQQNFVHLILFGHLMPLDFNVIVFAEDAEPPFEFLSGFCFAVPQNSLRHHRPDAAGGGNEPRVVLQNQFLVDARVLAIQSFDVAQRAEFH
jgi:hypothetical protein